MQIFNVCSSKTDRFSLQHNIKTNTQPTTSEPQLPAQFTTMTHNPVN